MTSPDITFTVRRSPRARRARLTVTPHGEAVVVLPMRAPERTAASLVERHGDWIDRQVARVRAERDRLDARPSLADGRTLTVAGVPRWVHARDARELEGLERSLRREAGILLRGRVEALSALVGVAPAGVTIRAQRGRWGSASRSGTVSLNWRLTLTPPEVLDYVVIHELAHLREPGHGPRFWSLVRHHAPQTDRARRWLREHHAELMSALD